MTENTDSVKFERGDKVKHPKWGIGTILYKTGSGERTKVIVLFQDAGQKTLMIKFAKLEKISSSSVKFKNEVFVEDIEEEPEEESEEVEEVEDVEGSDDFSDSDEQENDEL